jgi:hypothetical protein
MHDQPTIKICFKELVSCNFRLQMQETALPFPIRKRLNVYAKFLTNTTTKLRVLLSQSTHFAFFAKQESNHWLHATVTTHCMTLTARNHFLRCERHERQYNRKEFSYYVYEYTRSHTFVAPIQIHICVLWKCFADEFCSPGLTDSKAVLLWR